MLPKILKNRKFVFLVTKNILRYNKLKFCSDLFLKYNNDLSFLIKLSK